MFKAKSVTRTVVQLKHAIYTKVTSARKCLKNINCVMYNYDQLEKRIVVSAQNKS